MKLCPFNPDIVCERKRCYWSCPHRRKQDLRGIRYPIPICTYEGKCKYKGQMKDLKLPICKFYDKETKQLLYCSNQLIVSKTWLSRHKPDIETLRKMWWKMKKAGVI